MTADELRRDIETSRRAIQRDYTALRTELDFVTKTKQSIVTNPLPWLGGSALIGWILSGRSRKKARKGKLGKAAAEPVKKITIVSLLFGLARLLFPVARPLITNYAIDRLTDYTTKRRR